MNIISIIYVLIFIGSTCCLPDEGYIEFKFPSDKNQEIPKTTYPNTFIDVAIKCKKSQEIKLMTIVKKQICKNEDVTKNQYDFTPDTFEISKKCIGGNIINNLTLNEVISNDFRNSSKHYLVTKYDGNFNFIFQVQPEKENIVIVTVKIYSNYGYLSGRDYPFLIFFSVMTAVYSLMAIVWCVLCCRQWSDLLRLQYGIALVILLGMLEKSAFLAEYSSINQTGVPLKYPIMLAHIISCIKRTLARILIMVVCIGYGIVKPRLGPALRKILSVGVAFFIAAIIESFIKVLHPELTRTKYSFIPDIALMVVDSLILWWSFSYLIQTIKQMRMRRNVVKFNLYRHFSNVIIMVVITSVIFMLWSIYTFQNGECIKSWKIFWVSEAFWHVLFSIVLCTIMLLWRPSQNNQRYAYSPLLDREDMADDDDDVANGDDEANLNDYSNVMSMQQINAADADAESSDNNDDGDKPHKSKQLTKSSSTRGKKSSDGQVEHHNFTGGQLRQSGPNNQSRKSTKNNVNTAEDDLKWIEENIPSSTVEKIYPLMDSDEEMTPSKISAGKMD